jgi:hypothetical protein
MEIEELEEQYSQLSEKIHNGLDSYLEKYTDDPTQLFVAMNEYYNLNNVKAMTKKQREISFEIKKKTKVEWQDIPDYAHMMPIEKWISCVESGGFIDDDGFGNYAKKDKVSNISVIPSNYKNGMMIENKEFTHIAWYNT